MSQIRSHFDAVVIGSGFGGSISANRLSSAGKSVLVLERGQRWRRGEFPRDIRDVDRVFWRWPSRRGSRGLYDVRFFSSLGAVVASGVGGGSLIYANIHIRPDPIVFADPRWPARIKRESLDPYYDRVRDMLGISPVPSSISLVKRDRFREAAKEIGREIFDPDQAVSWSDPGEPGREACRLVAECEFGCQYGAKNTVDLTYLARAEKNGAKVEPHMNVDVIEPLEDGYRVCYRNTVDGGAGSVECKLVILAAGTLGTNEILLRSRAAGALPLLSARLGSGYSANGDFLGSIQNSRFDLKPWVGTDVTSVIRCFETPPEFTMAAPTFNRDTMIFLAALGQHDLRRLSWLAPFIWRTMPGLVPLLCQSGFLNWVLSRARSDDSRASRMTNLFAIGRDNSNGMIRLKGRRIDIDWDYANENRELVQCMERTMRAVNNVYGGTFAPLFFWGLFGRIFTVHSLGGCALSDSPDGVTSPTGEVYSYPGLFIADGSIIPTSIGFHPCMTIAALAEYIAEAAVKRLQR